MALEVGLIDSMGLVFEDGCRLRSGRPVFCCRWDLVIDAYDVAPKCCLCGVEWRSCAFFIAAPIGMYCEALISLALIRFRRAGHP
jgi:hypothetical protein